MCHTDGCVILMGVSCSISFLQLSAWSNSKYKLGQFTGQVSVQAIPMADHNKGQQAWVRRDMFKNLKPLEGGFGMKMLMSMGWQPGNPLGKSGQGQTEPISEDLKLDRKCKLLV